MVDAYTDGSALNPKHPKIRRAGWGLCVPALGIEEFGPVVGRRQTAVRGEIRAMAAALERTTGAIRVWTDCKAVIRGFAKLSEPHHRKPHGDLWERIERAARDRA